MNDYHSCQNFILVLDNRVADDKSCYKPRSFMHRIMKAKHGISFTCHLTSSKRVSPKPPSFPFMCIAQAKMSLPVFYIYTCTAKCTLIFVAI